MGPNTPKQKREKLKRKEQVGNINKPGQVHPIWIWIQQVYRQVIEMDVENKSVGIQPNKISHPRRHGFRAVEDRGQDCTKSPRSSTPSPGRLLLLRPSARSPPRPSCALYCYLIVSIPSCWLSSSRCERTLHVVRSQAVEAYVCFAGKKTQGCSFCGFCFRKRSWREEALMREVHRGACELQQQPWRRRRQQQRR